MSNNVIHVNFNQPAENTDDQMFDYDQTSFDEYADDNSLENHLSSDVWASYYSSVVVEDVIADLESKGFDLTSEIVNPDDILNEQFNILYEQLYFTVMTLLELQENPVYIEDPEEDFTPKNDN